MQIAGLFDRPWDFAVTGVTSISIDVHKYAPLIPPVAALPSSPPVVPRGRYGYASKGASVCAFREPALRRATIFPSADGCEGLYVTPTLQGSRSGATMAVAWATLVHVGTAGYTKSARELTEAANKLKEVVRSASPLHTARGHVACPPSLDHPLAPRGMPSLT